MSNEIQNEKKMFVTIDNIGNQSLKEYPNE